MKSTLESNLFGRRIPVNRRIAKIALSVTFLTLPAFAQNNVVAVAVEGCGVPGATAPTCAITGGIGGANTPPGKLPGSSTTGGYGDNQAGPLSLFYFNVSGTFSATLANVLVLPQTASGSNFPVSGEYGSSSEGALQLSGNGTYLTIMGYGINAATFNAAYPPGFTTDLYGAAPSGALAQSGSLNTGQSYTAVPRVIALIDQNGNVNSQTAIYNIFSTNNPRSVFTADGIGHAYVSGQGSGADGTGGVFYVSLGGQVNSPTAITGLDTSSKTIAQDTREVQIFNNTLYVSVDSKEGSGNNRDFIGTLGTPPATSLFNSSNGPTRIAGFGNSGGTGKFTPTTLQQTNGINSVNHEINLSPQNYFFANSTTLYVADGGSPKNDSATNDSGGTALGNGGLQKWINTAGTWNLAYTIAAGLNLVQNAASNPANTSGSTGLHGLTGVVSGSNVYLFATNYTIGDLDQTYLYGLTDVLSATSPAQGEAFMQLAVAPPDSNFKGVALAPSGALPATNGVTITSVPYGLEFASSGTGCAPNTGGTFYTTPFTLNWTPGSNCTLTVAGTQSGPTGTQYVFNQWEDSTTSTTRGIAAPSAPTIYTANFTTQYQLATSAGAGGSVSPGGYIPAGTNTTITATPAAGYNFVNFTGTTTSTANPLTLTMNAPQTIAANFTPGPTALGGGTIGLKSGPQSARVWPIRIGNNGPGAAVGAAITNLVLTQTLGAACAPSIVSAFPVVAGTIAPGAFATANVTIDFTGCPANAFFRVTETMSANSGAATGSAVQLNQLR